MPLRSKPTFARVSSLEPSPRRRHRSRQREQLLELLRSTGAHPTAADLHETLRRQCSQLSLGTVYRNLELLVSEGRVEKLPTEGAAMRYDANLESHHHFVCEGCGAIEDVKLPLPPQLERRLRHSYRLRASRIRIQFMGRCRECSDRGKKRTHDARRRVKSHG